VTVADVNVQDRRHADTGSGVTLGAAVDLDPRVTVGARLWSGTVIGFGVVHPEHFPIPSTVEAHTVVIVSGTGACIDVWDLRYAIPRTRDGRHG
jgi:hypothetical protein